MERGDRVSILDTLREKANSLPMTPGVYIMKNSSGEIIYVGKSKKLKARVTTYFTGNGHTPKTAKMVSCVRDFDYIVCDSEIEALTLENVLIKKHAPKYNIKLKDAKSYPFVKITREEYPRLAVTRDRSGEGKYYGPYQSAAAAYSALDTVRRIFSLPTCRRVFPKDIGKERPCIYKDMGRCAAPCDGSIGASEYRERVKCAEEIFKGNVKSTRALLEGQMEEAAERLEFERAAALRDSIRALGQLREKQKVVADAKLMRDVFAFYNGESESVLGVLSIREGVLANKNQFILSSPLDEGGEGAVGLIVNYYDGIGEVPREIMLDFEIPEEDRELISEYLSIVASHKVAVKIPERGEGRALCDMALENAKEAARQHSLESEREDRNLKRLAQLLGLSELPLRIEAYDISNIGNENITASMVVYSCGKLKKSDYRFFTVKTTRGADDYGSMREVIGRRLKHIGDGSPSLGETCDLILLDGGDNHVRVIKALLSEMELEIPVFGMVKDDYHKTRAITDGYTEISIAREMGVYGFVYNLQEEAHRFALKNSQGAKRRALTHSTLEKIKGIGQKKARALLSEMPLAKIKTASFEELSRVKGISERDAKAIYDYYHKPK
jgi:excinuclease ABC subunit C